jgi:putative transposase
MPRANRHFLPGLVWHITHRCHRREFLLKFARDRNNYLHWLFQARKRYGLCLLNYMITSNHIHLLVLDSGDGVIASSMQLAAGRTAQQYNNRKTRQGAFWEDRYHATAIETDAHLHRCIVYIDMNMVRAGVVNHPQAWTHSGYDEIQNPPNRYRLIDLGALANLCGFNSTPTLQRAHRDWVQSALAEDASLRQSHWTESIAVGSETFTREVKTKLGLAARYRDVMKAEDSHALSEPHSAYTGYFDGEIAPLRIDNTRDWNLNA